MGYDRRVILDHVVRRLATAPRPTLDELARELEVERHTVERALAAQGASFRRLQRGATVSAIARLRAAHPPLSQKTIAYELGFASPAALAHFQRRQRLSALLHQNVTICAKVRS